MLVIAIPVGIVIGLSLGALGGGGSILTVPALVYLLSQNPHSATMGSLLIVGVAAAAGTAAHWRGGRVRVGQGGTFGVLGVAGSYLGTRLSAGVDPDVLLTAFAGLMLFAAIAMLRRVGKHAVPGSARGSAVGFSADGSRSRCEPKPVESAVASEEPAAIDATDSGKVLSPTPPLDVRRAAEVVVAATVVGFLTGFFGVGGGFVIVPVLVVALDFEMSVAVGTSLLVIALNSIVALAARMEGHTAVDWSLLGVLMLTAIIGSLGGNRVATRVDPTKLATAFAVLLVAVAMYTGARSVPHLFHRPVFAHGGHLANQSSRQVPLIGAVGSLGLTRRPGSAHLHRRATPSTGVRSCGAIVCVARQQRSARERR